MGRDEELAELAASLGPRRVITIAGAPGIGKSRLAFELVAGHRGKAQVVELAALAASAQVGAAVAGALSVDEVPGEAIAATLVTRIGEKRLLLVLDNCEHLLGACAELVDWLASSCPGLSILTTSREPLGIGAEHVWQLAPLALPDRETAEPEKLASYAAVALFVERAAEVQPGFVLNAFVAPAVAEICRRLDGIPLAIELAAARVDSLTPAEIETHLDDRFGLLSQATPRGLSHHATLEAALDWSHELLSLPERALLRRLSVFPAAFDSVAAAAICAEGDPELDSGAIPALLAQLARKSLLGELDSPSEPRYRLLETIRAYATERLDEAGETPALRRSHARHYLALAERAEPELTGPGQAAWFERLEQERANLGAAVEWSLSRGKADWGLRLSGALVLFWRVRCHFGEGRELLEAALAVAGEERADLRAKALWGAGLVAGMAADVEASVARLEQCLALCEQSGDRQLRARALLGLGDAALERGDPKAVSLLEESAALARATGDAWCLVHALGLVGFHRDACGELAEAHSLFDEGLALARESGDLQSLRYGLIGLGFVCISQGDFRTAERLLEEALAVTTELGEDYGRATALHYLGRLAFRRSEYERARRLLEGALALMPELGPREARYGPLLYLAQVAAGQGDCAGARAFLDEALAAAPPGVDIPDAVLHGMADLAAAEGDRPAARRLLEQALASARRSGGGDAAACALHALAELSRTEEDLKAAAELHHDALEIRRETGNAPGIVASIEAVAGIDPAAGGHEHSVRLLGAAQALRDQNGYGRSSGESSRYEADVALLRERLPAACFAAAFEEGAALSIDQAVAEALKRPRRRGRAAGGWESLTQSEQRVAQLAAEGLTNSEIGKRLFISPATVKFHLSNVFRKLDMPGRTALARELANGQGAPNGHGGPNDQG